MNMTENRKLKVFLCHSKDDKPKVRDLHQRLMADDFDVWLDEEKLMPGQDWDLEIRKAVHESDVVVVCLSKDSITKTGYVQKEIRFALDVADEQPEGATFIIPARLEECKTPNRLSKWQWVDLFTDIGYEKLKNSLSYQANKTGNLGPPVLQKKSTNIIEPQMVEIPAGKFLMGSTKGQAMQAISDGADRHRVGWEQPQHRVEISKYFIGKYLITNQQYQAFVIESGKSPQDWIGDQYPHGKDAHPVVNVSWEDVTAYCTWLSVRTRKFYRLPTEAEWEKASRGADGRIWSWGNELTEKNANIAEAKIGNTTPVGQFSPQGDSPYGCADMIGNVWEWCNDWLSEKHYKTHSEKVKDPQGPNSGKYRVLRGGSFVNSYIDSRCALRYGYYPYVFIRYCGFRVALSAEK